MGREMPMPHKKISISCGFRCLGSCGPASRAYKALSGTRSSSRSFAIRGMAFARDPSDEVMPKKRLAILSAYMPPEGVHTMLNQNLTLATRILMGNTFAAGDLEGGQENDSYIKRQ
jgi:hypothetical protein